MTKVLSDYDINIPKFIPRPKAHKPKQYVKQITSFNNLVKLYDVNLKLSDAFNRVVEAFNCKFSSPDKCANAFVRACNNNRIYPSTLHFNDFEYPLSICVDDCVAHSFPSSPYKQFQDQSVVTFDATGYNGFYHSDLAHTFCKKPTKHNDRLIQATQEALYTAIMQCKPGKPYSIIGNTVSGVAKKHGLHVINGLSGHGIGEHIHMLPHVPNIPNTLPHIMHQGDVFTIEPLFALGTNKIMASKQGIYTADGSNSAHFERVVLITEGGHEILNDW